MDVDVNIRLSYDAFAPKEHTAPIQNILVTVVTDRTINKATTAPEKIAGVRSAMLHFTQCLTDKHETCPKEVEVEDRLIVCPCKCHKYPMWDRKWERI